MSNSSASAPPVRFVIWDLDGTILGTETVLIEVLSQVLSENGESVTPEIEKIAAGVRPLDAWKTVVDMLGMKKTPEALYARSEELLNPRWSEVSILPGALRALKHLKSNGIRMALATSTYQRNLVKKMVGREHLKEFFEVVVCGDEVDNGKPNPEMFLKAAELLGGKPEECLVVEDAPAGAQAGIAAGMRVLVVPSLTDVESYPSVSSSKLHGVIEILPSLLNFNPTEYGHPPFTDYVCGAIPVSPTLCMKGTVVKGFGRGSKELGIPTANLDNESIKSTVAKAVTGIYLGWASISTSPTVYKMVMSIGWNPFYKNKKKTAEPWLLHTFEEDFYDEEIRVVACGYIRPEANFNSLEELIARIHKDADISRDALEHASMSKYKDDSFLKPTKS